MWQMMCDVSELKRSLNERQKRNPWFEASLADSFPSIQLSDVCWCLHPCKDELSNTALLSSEASAKAVG